jgi:non-specific serine/threonine protein kinase/serine/threonine-protein kinase
MSFKAARELFDACLPLDAAERARLLESYPDPAVRAQVRTLLDAHAQAEVEGDPLLAARPTLPAPDWIGPYRVLERIGEGAMGDVYLAAQHSPVRRRVAIKVLKPGMDTREVIARFELERQTLALMTHENVARMLDAGATDAGRPYFVMEHVAGVPIARYCDERWLDVRSRLELFLQVCAGVQHAHHRGIIHRDLKPSNVLVAEVDGRATPKIIDFGIAKATAAAGPIGGPHTRLGNFLGTPGYMSPEQAALSPLDIDTRTDVYSLGAMLYELLTGTVPDVAVVASTSPLEIARALRDHEAERASERVRRGGADAQARAERRGRTPARLAAELRQDLDWILAKALERDRRRRYDSVAELCADLRAHLADEPVSAGPPSAAYRLRKFARRHRVLVGSTVALVVASIAFGSMMALQARATARERDRAELEAATASRVSAFMIDLFKVSDPGAGGGGAVTARQLLNDAAARLANELRDEPVVRGRLQAAIGEVYTNLGLYPDAQRQYELARDAFAGRVPPHDVNLLGAERGLARSLIRTGTPADAEPALRRIYSIARERYGEAHPLFADTANDLASLYFFLGKHEPALELYGIAHRARSAAYGPDAATTIQSLTNKAVVHAMIGQMDRAEATFRDVIARLTRVHGLEHPSTLNAEQNLATMLGNTGQTPKALAVYETLLPRYRRVMGETHPDTLIVTGNYASRLRESGRAQEAYRMHERVVAELARTLGPQAQETMSWELHLARDVAVLGRRAEAERRMRELAARQARLIGEDHRETLQTRLALADVVLEQGRVADARALYLELLPRVRAHAGPGSDSAQWALLALTRLEAAAGRMSEAKRWWREARAAGAGKNLADAAPDVAKLVASGALGE